MALADTLEHPFQDAEAGCFCSAAAASADADAVLRLYALTPEERVRQGENSRRYFITHFDSQPSA